MDPFAEVCVLTDEDVVGDDTPHVESAVAIGLDVTAEADPLARDDVSTTDPELDGTLSTDDDVPVGHEVVFLDVRLVGDDEFVQRVRTEGRHTSNTVFGRIKARCRV